jgi:outer membrane protein W
LTSQTTIRKIALSLTAFLALNILTFSSPERTIPQGSVEFTLGIYSMNEPRFEAAYPSGGVMGGLTLSSVVASNVNFYLDIKYYSRQGTLTFSKEKTTFYMVPIDLGVRYIYPLGFFNPYLGAGLDFYFYYEDNPIGTVLNYTNGYHITGGTYLRFAKRVPVMVNFRLKYTWAKAEQNATQIQLGGLEYSAGLAFAF